MRMIAYRWLRLQATLLTALTFVRRVFGGQETLARHRFRDPELARWASMARELGLTMMGVSSATLDNYLLTQATGSGYANWFSVHLSTGPATSGANEIAAGTAFTINSATVSGTTVTIGTTGTTTYTTGQTVTIAGLANGGGTNWANANGTWTLIGGGSNTFTYTVSSGTPTSTSNNTGTGSFLNVVLTNGSCTYSTGVVSLTTAEAHGLVVGNSFVLTGLTGTGWSALNGTPGTAQGQLTVLSTGSTTTLTASVPTTSYATNPGGTGLLSVGYSRVPLYWNSASGSQITNQGTLVSNIPAGTTITTFGTWAAQNGLTPGNGYCFGGTLTTITFTGAGTITVAAAGLVESLS